MKPARSGVVKRHLPGSPFNVPVVEEPVEIYEAGDLVTHDKYGLGTVLAVQDESGLLVDFGTQRVRVTIPCAKLFKL
jgi:hypothetical protein